MQAKGKYAFIGSSTFLFGFNEGMNEHGVTVTASVGGIPVGKLEGLCPPIQDGLQFWVMVRAVLEQCQTVDQAIQLIEAIPTSGNPILIVADKTGQAALVEVYGPHKAVKRIDARSGEQFLCATNHFTLPAMLPYTKPGVMAHSQVRYETIRAHLTEKQPVGRESIKSLLAANYPAGLCCHYYDELFGTLRSMIFDPTAGELEVCFGSPSANAWHRVSFSTPMNRYIAQLPIESTSSDFWRLVSDESSH
jgi:predicted choloylglycine hydrolase